ncbi:hypothetical protein [Streptomyces sp. NPDC007905]
MQYALRHPGSAHPSGTAVDQHDADPVPANSERAHRRSRLTV